MLTKAFDKSARLRKPFRYPSRRSDDPLALDPAAHPCAGDRAVVSEQPVRMIIPFAPGGASDFVGRIMQPKMGELLGQPIVVENKPGAAG